MIEGPIQTNNSGLVFYFDTKEPKSYVGEPTTNLEANPIDFSLWTSGATTTVTANASYAPNGTLKATRVITTGFWGSIISSPSNSTIYTWSIYLKSNTGGNQTIQCFFEDNGNYGSTFVAVNFAVTPQWERFSITATSATSTSIPRFSIRNGDLLAWGIQLEQKSHMSAFTTTSRSNTQGLLDLIGNYTVDLTNAAYDSSSKIYLSGSKAIKINSNSSLFSNAFTWSAWHYIIADGGTGYAGIFWAEGAVAGGSGYQYLLSYRNLGSNAYAHYRINNATTGWANTDTGTLTSSMLNKWIYTTWTFNNGTTKIYINGVLSHTDTSRGAYNGGSDSPIYIGARNDLWGSINGYIDLASYHNRALTDAEILKNFNSQRSRYSV